MLRHYSLWGPSVSVSHLLQHILDDRGEKLWRLLVHDVADAFQNDESAAYDRRRDAECGYGRFQVYILHGAGEGECVGLAEGH